MNHRYHAKRFLYLCIVKKYLKSSSSSLKVEWSTFQNEARKPILVVYPGLRFCDITLVCCLLYSSNFSNTDIILCCTFSTKRKFFFGFVAKELVEIPEFSVRLIPTGTSLFSASKLNMERNNVRALNQCTI